ncbi:uncharacterized protein SCHCODRAFT_02629323 [Schizophyllum commune H4-8]|uniref:uncharacterized protein n=1 Tax=Schizophyllum commune (strain H4-8 / FGSC 9210) TaxID=578458 RepID=UPI0021602D72|nr:uncharacterized protein SCHCODRAFT_02629323 [Schizophyllum commune H4-8]KAI5891513.1 hypothetical protein SCHCODRAFT_02629323 [Schizophyllum commune H4-8]
MLRLRHMEGRAVVERTENVDRDREGACCVREVTFSTSLPRAHLTTNAGLHDIEALNSCGSRSRSSRGSPMRTRSLIQKLRFDWRRLTRRGP